jgi:D-methionine transport system substrate-binding protein
MKIKKVLTLTLSLLLTASMIGCSPAKGDDKEDTKAASKEDKVITVGATANPHAEILEEAKPLLKEKGYDLNIKVFNDYVLPNTALDEGSLDANFFQHIPYLEVTVKEKGYKLTYTSKVHLEPMGFYSEKLKDIKDIADGSTIAVPNDPTNGARALKLLADNGVIKVKDAELITKNDITENPKNIKIKEMNAEQLPTVLKDVDGAVINTNYALNANLNPLKDALAIESKDSPYSNILACREDNKDSEKIKALSDALNSKEVKAFIEEKYQGSIIPAFE